MKAEQNGRQFVDDVFKCIFLSENTWILISISQKCVPRGHWIDNKSSWIQVIAWHQTDDKPLPEPIMTYSTDAYVRHQGLYSLSSKTSYRQISWSLEAARLGVIMIVSLWNLTGISAALLPRCLLNFRAIGKVQTRISRLRHFARSCGKTSHRLVNRGPGLNQLTLHMPVVLGDTNKHNFESSTPKRWRFWRLTHKENNNNTISHSQCHDCWWPGDARSQCIASIIST